MMGLSYDVHTYNTPEESHGLLPCIGGLPCSLSMQCNAYWGAGNNELAAPIGVGT